MSTLWPLIPPSQPLPLQLPLERGCRLSGPENTREVRRPSLIPSHRSCTIPRGRILMLLQLIPTCRASERKQVCFEVQAIPSHDPQHWNEHFKPQYSHPDRKHGGSPRLLSLCPEFTSTGWRSIHNLDGASGAGLSHFSSGSEIYQLPTFSKLHKHSVPQFPHLLKKGEIKNYED